MNNLKELYQGWKNTRKKIDDTNIWINLPNYFLKMNNNDSLEKIASEITNELKKYDLVSFSCDTKYYVFSLSLPMHDDENFPSFKRFFDFYRHELSKFNIAYQGVLFIDISEWIRLHAYNRNQFKDFLEFINVIKEGIIIFFVSDTPWSDNEHAYRLIKNKIRVEQVEVRDDFTQEGVDYIKMLADNRDIKIEDKALKALPEMVSTILRVRGNRASESIRDVFNEILYQKSKNASDTLKTINFNDIKDYLKGGKFEKSMQMNASESVL